MKRRIAGLKELVGAQADASDPHIHASVSASAGSGKTQVLTARVLRLLLGGVAPESILCLTFTRAGAAEMANRISSRLAAWVRMPDPDLRTELVNLNEPVSSDRVARARQLFARVLEAPGGLRIQTIHSFAQTLLAAFPSEAGIAPGFQPVEGRAEQELARSTLAALAEDAEALGDEGLLDDLARLSLRLGEDGAVNYLKRCAANPNSMEVLGPPGSIEAKLRAVMTLPEDDESYLAEACHDDAFDCDLLRAIAAANRSWGGKTGQGHAERVETWLALVPGERAAMLPDLAMLLFTGKGDPRKVTSGQIKADPDYQLHADRLADAVAQLLTVQRGCALARTMAAGLRAGQAFARRYASAKRSAGLADFNDLIAWTRHLLGKPGISDWVRYKLDRRTDHILVDEAQDTNMSQWEIIQALAGEFFTGSSEDERRVRTLFLVGDFKQAIYGFQGTDPREFQVARNWLRDNAEALLEAEDEADDGQRLAAAFKDLSIEASFRSAPAVLDVVDATIREVTFEAMGMPERPNPHRAHHHRRPGLVELRKPYRVPDEDVGDDEDSEEAWIAERDRLFATELAADIRELVDEAPRLHSTGRQLNPGDILILVRSRGELASLIVARLFAEGVPVAGIDRLHLHKPLAVRDLLSAVTFAVQPLDDLNLANLLVSPLIGWDQQALFDLAHDRPSSLWRALRDRAGSRPDFTAAHDSLSSLLGMADYETPFRFLETVLSGPLQGRTRLYGRLGLDARDPIDELLSSALEYERNETPSLDRFLAWFASGEVEIKREAGEGGGMVRVMTVHGAKGLESPVVFLADSTGDPDRLGGPSTWIDMPMATVGRVPVIRPRKAEQMPPFTLLMEDKAARDREEHWRLLYVALTRAAERLVIAGIEPTRGRPDDSWHCRVERALTGLGADWQKDDRWGRVLRYEGDVPNRAGRAKAIPATLPPILVPDWALSPAPAEESPVRPLSPSSLGTDREPAAPPGPEARAAMERGTMVHRLFERLADIDGERRRESALRWFAGQAPDMDQATAGEIVDMVCNIMADPLFAPLFKSGSLAEAPLAATLADGRVIAGTVDRLLVEPDRVLVVDFKTGRVPSAAAAIPASHRTQMRAYAEALGVIFPGRGIEAALLYTDGPQLFALDG